MSLKSKTIFIVRFYLLLFCNNAFASSDTLNAFKELTGFIKQAYKFDQTIEFNAEFDIKIYEDTILASHISYNSTLKLYGNNFKTAISGLIVDINQDSLHLTVDLEKKIMEMTNAKDVSQRNMSIADLVKVISHNEMKVSYDSVTKVQPNQKSFYVEMDFGVGLFFVINKSSGFIEKILGGKPYMLSESKRGYMLFEFNYFNYIYTKSGCCNLSDFIYYDGKDFKPKEKYKDFVIRNKLI